MKDRYDVIMSNDLRDGMICVERAKGDKGMTKTGEKATGSEYKRLETLFGSFQERFAGFQSEMATNITYIKDDIDCLGRTIEKLTDIVNTTYAKVTNGLTDAALRHDRELASKISKDEFNSALKAIREEMKQTRRLMWGFFSLMVTLVGVLGTLFATGGG